MYYNLLIKDKKGFSQIDWTISLSLFLLFVSFTFILLNPGDTVFFDERTSLENIKFNLMNDYTVDLVEVPLFIETRQVGYYPFKTELNNLGGIKFVDNSKFAVVGDTLVFFFDVNGTSLQKDILSNSEFKHGNGKPQDTFLYDDNKTISIPSRSLNTDYDSKFNFEEISYLGRERIIDFKIIDDKNNTISFANRYKYESELSILLDRFNSDFKFESFFFSNFPIIQNRFDSQTNFSIKLTLDSYNSYYVNPILNNYIYGDEGCLSFDSDYLAFGSNKSIISFVFDDETKLIFCSNIDGTIDVEFNSPKEMDIYFSTSSLGSDYPTHDISSSYFGIKRKNKVASYSKLLNISSLSPISIRNRYGIAEDLKFSINVLNHEFDEVYTYEVEKPDSQTNVFVKRWNDYLLKEDNTKELVTFSVRVWQ